jgi:hypothetical protein
MILKQAGFSRKFRHWKKEQRNWINCAPQPSPASATLTTGIARKM